MKRIIYFLVKFWEKILIQEILEKQMVTKFQSWLIGLIASLCLFNKLQKIMSHDIQDVQKVSRQFKIKYIYNIKCTFWMTFCMSKDKILSGHPISSAQILNKTSNQNVVFTQNLIIKVLYFLIIYAFLPSIHKLINLIIIELFWY